MNNLWDGFSNEKKYYFKIFSFKTINGKRYYSSGSSKRAVTVPESRTINTISEISNVENWAAGIQIKWNRDSAVDGYYILRKRNDATGWTRVKEITSNSITKWVDESVVNGDKYTYALQAYKGIKKSVIKNEKITYRMNTPVFLGLKSNIAGEIKIKSDRNDCASGYKVQYSLKSDFSDFDEKYVNNKTELDNIWNGFDSGKKYYLKIYSFKKVGSKKYFSGASVKNSTLIPSSETKISVTKDPMYREMTSSDVEAFDNAFKISFVGDLILLEDQVKRAFDGEHYSFDDCFEYTRPYIEGADYAIGVFEGPLAGEAAGYSTSNYGDGKKLALNFPDGWADSVKIAGFDLVTTCTNHALDKGVKGFNRTIDVLTKKDLDFTGTYKNAEEKKSKEIKIVEKDGIKMAVLTYAVSVNGVTNDDLVTGTYSGNISSIVSPANVHFEEVKSRVKYDFERAKAENPDLIIVLPHWGTQFADSANSTQLAWNDIFKEYGADIVLGDHTHSVQPAYMVKENKKTTFTLYSPGNYANIYREYNGDFSAITEVYIDRKSKKVIGGAVVPMWTSSTLDGNYRAIPLHSIMTEPDLRRSLTTHDLVRVKEAQDHIIKVMLGETIPIESIQDRYCFDEKGYFRQPAKQIEITEAMKNNEAYKALTEANNVCFIGDSITEGTRNGGVGWYEPIESLVPGEVTKCGWGSHTVKMLYDNHINEINANDSDLYVIAIGANDIRYRRAARCAMNENEYIERLGILRSLILEKHPGAKFIFVAPWTSTDGDAQSRLSYKEKMKMYDTYSNALDQWTQETGDIYVNPNKKINYVLNHYPDSNYLMDAIHPNATKGVELYSEAFLSYENPKADISGTSGLQLIENPEGIQEEGESASEEVVEEVLEEVTEEVLEE